jgi:SAM-dependent methyltransferase
LWGVGLTDPFRLEAQYYDKIWGLAKKCKAEADVLNQILKKQGASRILDLGCGTGSHCLELSKLGYDMVGLDISETMLRKAKKKFSEDVQAEFVLGDMINVYSSLKSAKIALPFDAVICMGYSFAHLVDDESLGETLMEVQKVLKPKGIFIFCVRNAKRLRDDLIRQLRMDTIVNEPGLQLALLCYNFRDNKNPDVLVWNALWLIKDRGKIDFQIRTHPLRWFRYDDSRATLETHRYSVIHTYGDTLGREEFDENTHDTMFMICRKE